LNSWSPRREPFHLVFKERAQPPNQPNRVDQESRLNDFPRSEWPS